MVPQCTVHGIVDKVGLGIVIPCNSKSFFKLLADVQREPDIRCGRVDQGEYAFIGCGQYGGKIVGIQIHGSNVHLKISRVGIIEGEEDVIGFKARHVIASQGQTSIDWARSVWIACSITPTQGGNQTALVQL